MGVGFLGWLFASLVDEQGMAEEFNSFYELGVALFGGRDGGHRSWSAGDCRVRVLGVAQHNGENKYGPQPE